MEEEKMGVSKHDKENVLNFFDKNQILTECFLELYEYQKISVPDAELEFRDGLLGFKRKGEKLRLYVTKDKNGAYRIKIKVSTSHLFLPAEMINYQSDIDKNNILFNREKQTIKVVENKRDDSVIKVNKPKKDKEVKIKRAVNSRGMQYFNIYKLPIDNIQPILDCVNEFKRDKIKNIKIKIIETD